MEKSELLKRIEELESQVLSYKIKSLEEEIQFEQYLKDLQDEYENTQVLMPDISKGVRK